VKLWKSSFLATNFSRACVLCMKVAKLEVAHGLRLSSADSRCRLVTGGPKVNFLYCFLFTSVYVSLVVKLEVFYLLAYLIILITISASYPKMM